MRAYIDESARWTPEIHYVIAAIVPLGDDLEPARASARRLLLPRQIRWHWRDETERRRFAMIETLAAANLHVLGSQYRGAQDRHQERARALCLTQLVWSCGRHGIDELVLEAREPTLNRRDQRTISYAQRAGGASRHLRYEFRRAGEEPLLWFADAAAGALSLAAAGQDQRYLELLSDRVELSEVQQTP